MEKFFKDQQDSNFKINATLNSESEVVKEKINALNSSYLLDNPDFVEKSDKLNYELLQLDRKWATLAMEFEKIFQSHFPNKAFLLESKQKEIDKITKDVEDKEYELVSLRLDTKKEQFQRMVKEN